MSELSSAHSGASAGRNGGRAFGLGPRPRLLVGTAVLAAALAALVSLSLSSHGGSAALRSSTRYGGLPAWLPKPKLAVRRVVQASAAHPWLSAIEGDTISVHLARGSVLATVIGPAVPAYVAERAQDDDDDGDSDTAPSTFTVTFRSASGAVPIDSGAFAILDERGQIHRLLVSTPGGAPHRRG